MSDQKTENLTFGEALEVVKAGGYIARDNWNGKGMYVYLEPGRMDGTSLGFELGERIPYDHPSTLYGVSVGLFLPCASYMPVQTPYLTMKSAQGSSQPGWTATQTDMLAVDWRVVSLP